MPTLQLYRGIEADIPVLQDGEPGFTTDTYKLYVGDGVTNHLIGPTSDGITDLNGETGTTQTFSKQDDTNVTLTIASATDNHDFALGWTGQLAASRGGTGADLSSGTGIIKMASGTGSVTNGSSYTQTYSTASATNANLTSATLTDSTGGTPGTTVNDVGAAFSQSTLNDNFASLVDQINKLRADLENAKQVINQLVDDLQASGYAT